MAYGTLEGGEEYHETRGNLEWLNLDEDAREAARVRASMYLDVLYAPRFPGTKTGGADQIDQWPRTGATYIDGTPIASDEVPREMEWATYEAMAREQATPGSLAPDVAWDKKKVLTEVKGIKWEVIKPAEDANPLQGYLPVFPIIEGLLYPILTGPPSASGDFSGQILVV